MHSVPRLRPFGYNIHLILCNDTFIKSLLINNALQLLDMSSTKYGLWQEVRAVIPLIYCVMTQD